MDNNMIVQVGKNGMTNAVLDEIRVQLKKRKVVKIKFLQNTERENMKEKAKSISNAVHAEIIDIRGFTVTIKKI